MSLRTAAASRVKPCPTLGDPIDGSPPGSPVPGIPQARTLEWVAISFSNAWKWKWRHSVVSNSSRPHGLYPTSASVHGIFQEEYWSGLPCPSPPLRTATAAAKSLQSCPTLCDPVPPLGFSRQEHWSGLPFPSPLHKSESEVAQPCPWTAAYLAPLSMGFSRQEYWSGVPLPSLPLRTMKY